MQIVHENGPFWILRCGNAMGYDPDQMLYLNINAECGNDKGNGAQDKKNLHTSYKQGPDLIDLRRPLEGRGFLFLVPL